MMTNIHFAIYLIETLKLDFKCFILFVCQRLSEKKSDLENVEITLAKLNQIKKTVLVNLSSQINNFDVKISPLFY